MVDGWFDGRIAHKFHSNFLCVRWAFNQKVNFVHSEDLPENIIILFHYLNTNAISSLEIRVGNSSDHQSDNPLCNWLTSKDFSRKAEEKYVVVSCSDEPYVIGRYVSFIANDFDVPLTLCQGNYQTHHLNPSSIYI